MKSYKKNIEYYIKEKNLDKKYIENIFNMYNIDKYNDKYDYFDAVEEYKKTKSISLSDLIKMYGLESVMLQLSDNYTIDQILEFLDIKDVQQFLRKKKLEQLKTKDDV